MPHATKCHTTCLMGATPWIRGDQLENPTSRGVGMMKASSVYLLFILSTWYIITQKWWHQEHLLFDHFLVRIMVPICHVRMSSAGVLALVWTASGMGHWKKLIKILGDIDCYYCIIILLHILYIMIILFIVILLYMHVLLFMSCYYPTLHVFYVGMSYMYTHDTINDCYGV